MHGSRSAERMSGYGQDAEEETTDEEDSPIRWIDHSINHISRKQSASRTTLPHDHTSFSSINNRTPTFHTSRPFQEDESESMAALDPATSRITPPRNDKSTLSAHNRASPSLHQTSSLHPDSQTKTSSSSASPSSFQRRFREIQSQSPGKVSWGRDVRVESDQGSGIEVDRVQRDRSGTTIGGMTSSTRERSLGLLEQETNGSQGAARDVAAERESSGRERSGRLSTGAAPMRDVFPGASKRRIGEGDESTRDRSWISMKGTASTMDRSTTTSKGQDEQNAGRSPSSKAQDRSLSPITNTVHDAIPAPPPSAREMSFAQIDHSTPVRGGPGLRVRGIFASSEDDDTVDSESSLP